MPSRSPFEDGVGGKEPISSPFDDSNRFQDVEMVPMEEDVKDTNTTVYDEFGDGPYKEEDDMDDDYSMEPTPIVGRSDNGQFNDDNRVLMFGPDDLERRAQPGKNRESKSGDQIKRLRWGTQRRRKSFKRYDIGRSKTLKWAKKNIQDPLEELIGNENEATDETGMRNKADELRNIYFNQPLPQDMLDEDNKPLANYPRNKIRTTKYTPLTFLPKNILLQFHNFANIYFLILIILGAFQIFGVTNPGFSAVPLIVIIIITAIKDGIEDSRRTVLDLEVNNTKTHVLTGVENYNVSADDISLWRRFKKANSRIIASFVQVCRETLTKKGRLEKAQRKRQMANHKKNLNRKFRNSLNSYRSNRMSRDVRPSMDFRPSMDINGYQQNEDTLINKTLPTDMEWRFSKDYWKNVKVGDIVRIHNNEEIPADIILLSTSDSDGACYVETKNLDGETNLKVRQSMKCTSDIRSSIDIARTRFWIESEGPHANLYSYQGNFRWNSLEDNQLKNEPVNINNLLLRGCTLRNTKWAMGVVAFTGDDTKIMLNAGDRKSVV